MTRVAYEIARVRLEVAYRAKLVRIQLGIGFSYVRYWLAWLAHQFRMLRTRLRFARSMGRIRWRYWLAWLALRMIYLRDSILARARLEVRLSLIEPALFPWRLARASRLAWNEAKKQFGRK